CGPERCQALSRPRHFPGLSREVPGTFPAVQHAAGGTTLVRHELPPLALLLAPPHLPPLVELVRRSAGARRRAGAGRAAARPRRLRHRALPARGARDLAVAAGLALAARRGPAAAPRPRADRRRARPAQRLDLQPALRRRPAPGA